MLSLFANKQTYRFSREWVSISHYSKYFNPLTHPVGQYSNIPYILILLSAHSPRWPGKTWSWCPLPGGNHIETDVDDDVDRDDGEDDVDEGDGDEDDENLSRGSDSLPVIERRLELVLSAPFCQLSLVVYHLWNTLHIQIQIQTQIQIKTQRKQQLRSTHYSILWS